MKFYMCQINWMVALHNGEFYLGCRGSIHFLGEILHVFCRTRPISKRSFESIRKHNEKTEEFHPFVARETERLRADISEFIVNEMDKE